MYSVEDLFNIFGAKDDNDLAHKLGKSGGSTISNWRVTGKIPAAIILMAQKEVLKKEGGRPSHCHDGVDIVTVPVYRFAGAGPPQLVEYDPIQFLSVEKRYAKPSIAVIKVRGDSMMPKITPGAFVGVDKADKDVVSGAMYAVWLPYEGAVIKRLFMGPDEVRLKSENPEHDDIRLPASSIEDHLILGRVRWVLQEYEG